MQISPTVPSGPRLDAGFHRAGRGRGLRLVAGLAVAAVLSLIAAPGVASAAPDPSAASSSSAWLAAQLVDGRYNNPLAGGPDYGLMIDALFALHASGNGALAQPIVTVLDDNAEAVNFFSYAGFLGEAGKQDLIGGATAKTLVAALVAGRDPHHFGGYDMVAETQGVLTPDGPERGRVRDFGPDIGINNANTVDQSLAVLGLAGAGANDQPAIDQLLRQQCSEGYFRIFYGFDPDPPNTPNDCDAGKSFDQSSPDGDATGSALSALVAAQRAGATGLDDAIARTTSWLIAHQDPGGGWGGGVGTEAPNTNSTGLIVQALASAGGDESAVDRGRDYILSAQVTPASDSGDALGADIGAIGYSPGDYVAARSTGIDSRDTWIHASAQASLGLSQVAFFTLVTEPVAPASNPTTTPPTVDPVDGSTTLATETGADFTSPEVGTLPATGSSTTSLLVLSLVLVLAGLTLVGTERHARPHTPREHHP